MVNLREDDKGQRSIEQDLSRVKMNQHLSSLYKNCLLRFPSDFHLFSSFSFRLSLRIFFHLTHPGTHLTANYSKNISLFFIQINLKSKYCLLFWRKRHSNHFEINVSKTIYYFTKRKFKALKAPKGLILQVPDTKN